MFFKEKIKKYDNIGVTGLTNQLIAFYVDNIYKDTSRDILLLTNSLYEANKLYSSLSKFNKNTLFFPMDDFLTSEAIAISPELKTVRINTLNTLSNNEGPSIVVTNLMGLLRYLPTKKLWKNKILILEKGQEIEKEKVRKYLASLGYVNDSIVTKTGEYASRGFVLDIFPMNSDNPIRIEFWGDEIDSIRYFDVDNQRSLKSIDKVEITPFSEFINDKNKEIEEKQKYLPYVVDEVGSIVDYLNSPITIFKDYNQIKNAYFNLKTEIFEYSKTDESNLKTNYMNDLESLKFNDKLYFMTIDNILDDIKLDKVYDINGRGINSFNSNISLINDYIKNKLYQKKTVVIVLTDNQKLKSIKKFISIPFEITKIDNLKKEKLNIIIDDYEEGFELDDTVFITEVELFGERRKKTSFKSKFKMGTKIKELNNLNVGDYVVHLNHGIGIYNGIKTLTKNGNKKDYLEIKYFGNDKLYIPVEKMELISKYSGKEGFAPKINKLSGSEWQKTKLKIKNKIKNIAGDLLKVSAERKMKEGFKFKEDDSLQQEFENEFKYDLTKDQFISLNKIKNLMEQNYPMDMLLCGDVGYGKTEVAFRAIFKAIDSGKQVAYLCPTTILSNQQYQNALDRFMNFGINIALINRFTTRKETIDIIEKLKTGKIDLIFGTHRLLSNDIKFKDLGLLVIDEEQRFGVVHKEKIKKYKSTIDVLTLSATPIPRTLQMSLVGIRELALIETPPASRYPVQTYVIEESHQLVREAIYKEMSRGGQVFILFNNIAEIENKLSEIKSLVPEASIKIAHGQMTKIEIEDTMNSFINNEFDILLCTTIIETGIDIPNVNTLIIYNADRFGLSQLYQIRGRVGRSNKIAYAYLMYSKNKVLNDIAVKRLNAIKEFTELGSGFSIAMRDLSIRGAGDILGSEQAGFIADVGYDLYVKLLNEEVDRLNGKEIESEEDVENEKTLVEVSTHIDDNYVGDDSLKIEIHKLINEISSSDSLEKVKEELTDRFGKLDDDLIIYMYSEWLEKLAKKLNITEFNQTSLYAELVLNKDLVEKLDMEELFLEVSQINIKFKFNYKFEKLFIRLPLASLDKHFIYYFIDVLNKINDMLV